MNGLFLGSKRAMGTFPWILWWWFLGHVVLVEGSRGDRSYIYQRCTDDCEYENCTRPASLQHFRESQPWVEALLHWSCGDECRYQCMWTTVEAFRRDNIDVPQFYGKVGLDSRLNIGTCSNKVMFWVRDIYSVLIMMQ